MAARVPTAQRRGKKSRDRKPCRELPMLPGVLVRLLALDPRADGYFDELTKLAEEDPPLAVKILRFANGSESAPRVPITDVRAGIARIGAVQTGSLVTAASVARVFVPTTPGQKDLWVHAVEVGACARVLAQLDPHLRADANTAYTCGLLHDIGRFFMFERQASTFEQVETLNSQTHADILAAEQEATGHDHCQLGFEACVAWELPDKICRLVRSHHTFGEVDADIERLVRAVQVADLVSVVLMRSRAWEGLTQPELAAALEESCMHQEWGGAPPFNLGAFAARLPAAVSESEQMVRALGLA